MRPTDNIIGVIPARLGATRLPRKPLLPVAGVPMVQRVYEGACRCGRLREVVVATDAVEIAAFCRLQGIPVTMTSAEHPSGTDRVWETVEQRGAEAAINIQGDEPMVRAEMLEALAARLFSEPEIEIASLYTAAGEQDAAAASVCKVAVAQNGRALYFSRAAIPYPRSGTARYWKHLGFYAYSRAALNAFHSWTPSPLETVERLEQLRFLEHGMAIAMAETPFDTISVDTAQDLEQASAAVEAETSR
ncbi:MAG: 3-deoxy-manno-octulosonate cytidylyltransferase [Terriglobales bacterium]